MSRFLVVGLLLCAACGPGGRSGDPVVDAGAGMRNVYRVTPSGAETPLVLSGSLVAPVAVTQTRTSSELPSRPWNGKILVADGGAVRAIDASGPADDPEAYRPAHLAGGRSRRA